MSNADHEPTLDSMALAVEAMIPLVPKVTIPGTEGWADVPDRLRAAARTLRELQQMRRAVPNPQGCDETARPKE